MKYPAYMRSSKHPGMNLTKLERSSGCVELLLRLRANKTFLIFMTIIWSLHCYIRCNLCYFIVLVSLQLFLNLQNIY